MRVQWNDIFLVTAPVLQRSTSGCTTFMAASKVANQGRAIAEQPEKRIRCRNLKKVIRSECSDDLILSIVAPWLRGYGVST